MSAYPSPPPPRRSLTSVPLWSLAFVITLFLVACASVWAYILVTRPTASPRATPSAVFIVATSAPDEVGAAPTLILVDTPTPHLTPTIPPAPIAGSIQIGALVQIANTGGDGLRLRNDPGLDTLVNYLAIDFEVFQVQDGPREVDGFTWWFLVAQADSARNGWAVENYMQLVRGP